MNAKPVQIGNNLSWSFLYGNKAFDPDTGMRSISVTAQGLAFYIVSSIIFILGVAYGVGLYRLYRSKAMWTYFVALNFYALSFVATYILINGIGLNGVGIYEILVGNKTGSTNLNLFWKVTLKDGMMVYSKLSSQWIYNSAEIICFIVSLPMIYVYIKSRKHVEA
ncbi:hypothetical protein [Ureaplasma ceti]|uniref:Uncharacterized protein n=1 Tax=Ureaplasma ceti TaxID=3119530 RepID=A0ABP9U5X6_9BACT